MRSKATCTAYCRLQMPCSGMPFSRGMMVSCLRAAAIKQHLSSFRALATSTARCDPTEPTTCLKVSPWRVHSRIYQVNIYINICALNIYTHSLNSSRFVNSICVYWCQGRSDSPRFASIHSSLFSIPLNASHSSDIRPLISGRCSLLASTPTSRMQHPLHRQV